MGGGFGLQRFDVVPSGDCGGVRPPRFGGDALYLGSLSVGQGTTVDERIGLVGLLFCARDEQSPSDDCVGPSASSCLGFTKEGFLGRGVALSELCGRFSLLGVRLYFWGAADMACLRTFSLLCWNRSADLAGGEAKVDSLENGAFGASGCSAWSLALRLHAAGLADESADELGICQHEGGFFLFDQPESIFRKTFRSASQNSWKSDGSDPA